MGAWSAEPFGNDSAADWAWELDNARDWSVVDRALDLALVAGFIDDDDATTAIAAAEVVAHGLGHATQDDAYTDSVKNFISRQPAPPAALVQKARAALIAATGAESGLTELWNESDESAEWAAANARLASSLEAQSTVSPRDEQRQESRSTLSAIWSRLRHRGQ